MAQASAPEIPDGVELDPGYLLATDSRAGLDQDLAVFTREALQALVQSIFSLPSEMTEDGKVAVLPAGSYRTPREKHIPKDRPLTKWEQYAREKGIQKKKRRDRMVWNEDLQEYVPRYGRGSAKSEERMAILPHDNSLEPGDDPFAAARRKRKASVRENTKKHQANVARAEGRNSKRQRNTPVSAPDAVPAGPSGKRHIPKKQLKDSIAVVQRSSASAGRFDEKLRNEPKRKIAGQKRKLPEPTPRRGSISSEKERAQKILDRVLKK